MASHYDRLTDQYATRPGLIAGPSRGDPFYARDRDRRIPYTPRPEPEYIEEERSLPRRDERPFYPPQDYPGPSRESRGEVWTGTAWARHPPVYPPHSSPPPPPPVPAQYPRHYQDPKPSPSPRWEERSRWENSPDNRSFEPSVAWRHARREPSHPRLNSLLNPVPPSVRTVDYRRREQVSVLVDPPPQPVHDYGRSYQPDHLLYDDRRPLFHNRPPMPETPALIPNDTYRQPYVERPPNQWEAHTYRPEIIPAARANRTSAIGDYKRPRQESIGQSPRPLDNEAPYWTGEKGIESSRHSRQDSFQSSFSVGSGDRERSATGMFQAANRSIVGASNPSSPRKPSRDAWELSSDEHEVSGDEPVGGMVHISQTLKQTLSDISRSRDAFRDNDGRQERQDRGISQHAGPGASNNFSQTIPRRPPPRSLDKPSQPVIRHAWDPSTDQFVPIMDNNVQAPWPVDRRFTGSRAPADILNHSGPAAPVPYRHLSHVQRASPVVRANDVYLARKEGGMPTSDAAQGSGSGRQGVMSVHDLVSPAPLKPPVSSTSSQREPTPLLLDEDTLQVGTLTMREPCLAQRPVASKVPPQQRGAHAHTFQSEESPFVRNIFQDLSLRAESAPGLVRQCSPFDEPSIVGYSRVATPEIYTPEPDMDRTLAEVEVQIAETTISSPRPSILLLPGEKLSEDGTMRILAPRPKADERDIREMLRKAIVLRRTYDAQSRDQRVNPILMDNLAKSDGPEQKVPSSIGNLVEEVLERLLTRNEEEYQMNTRAVLATKFAKEREALAENTQSLRDEYLTLHRRWTAHCADLDSLFKANDMQESLTQAGRTTRRSATTLGDAVRSDLEMEQIIASLGNEDLTDPNHLAVRNVATIPDMISVVKGKVDYLFDDTNNEVTDPENFYDPRSGFCDWSPEEEAIFYAKYAEYPKQFGIIADFLPHKTSQQCVLYYYIHKKKLIDFRNAVNTGSGKRRKGVRKAGKQKGNALLADVAQADSKRPAGRGRRGRGGFNNGRGRGGGPPPTIEESGDNDPRAKRRKVVGTPRQYDFEDAQSVDTDNTRETSVLPPKKRRGRKPGPKPVVASDSPGQSPAPGETKFVEGNDTTSRRKPGSTSTYWSDSDRETFMRLLAQYGKDFKRISAALPNKTHVQVGNYYKNHNRELGLEKIALAAVNRTRSPEQDCFVTVTRAEASQSRTPTEEMSADRLVDRQVEDATSGVGVLTLEQNGKPGQSVVRATTNSRGITKESVIKLLNPDAFQSAAANKLQGVIITPNGQSAYSLDVARQPAQPQTSSFMSLQEPSGSSSQGDAEYGKMDQRNKYMHRPFVFMEEPTSQRRKDPYQSIPYQIPIHRLSTFSSRPQSTSQPPGDISMDTGRQE